MKLFLLIWALAVSEVNGQLSIGPHGITSKPINVLALFRYIRSTWNAIMYGAAIPSPEIAVANDKEITTTEVSTYSPSENSGYQLTGDPLFVDQEAETHITERLPSVCLDSEQCAEEEKSTSAQLIVGKWPIIYGIIISLLFWPLMVLATPYFFTGEPLDFKDTAESIERISSPTSENLLQLLSWILGETVNDPSCLERVVCLHPESSSRYIFYSDKILDIFHLFNWWLPYKPEHKQLLRRLDAAADYGYYYPDCEAYYCPASPDL